MAFCPRCGAASTPGLAFCAACGEMLPAVPAATPGAAADPALAGRATGKRVHPAFATLMSLLVASVYQPWFWWRTSREMDAYAGSRSHGIVRVGVALLLLGLALSIYVGASVASALDLMTLFGEEGFTVAMERFTEGVAEHPLTLPQLGTTALGAAITYAGAWRMWSALREEELRRGRSPAFDPRIALAFVLGATFLQLGGLAAAGTSLAPVLDLLGLVFLVGSLLVIYQTQARLNELWRAGGATAP